MSYDSEGNAVPVKFPPCHATKAGQDGAPWIEVI
jgi:hypothetical protein